MTEINLAVFYLKGTYHDLTKRIFGIRHVGAIGIPLASLTSHPSYHQYLNTLTQDHHPTLCWAC